MMLLSALAIAVGSSVAAAGGSIFFNRRGIRKTAYQQWKLYIDSLEVSIGRLRTLQDGMGQAAEMQVLSDEIRELARGVSKTIRIEIEELAGQLREISSDPRFLYYRKMVAWRPFPSIEKPIAGILRSFAMQANAGSDAKAPRSAPRLGLVLHTAIARLRGKNQEMAEILRRLMAEHDNLRTTWLDLQNPELLRGRGDFYEEAAAAHLMGELASGLPMEEIESRLSAAQKDAQECQNSISKMPVENPERARLVARYDWLQQVKRWWLVQRKIQHQESLLLSETNRVSEMMDSEYKQRLENWLKHHGIEDENALLRDQIGNLSVKNRMLVRYVDTFKMEASLIEEFRRRVWDGKNAEIHSSKDLRKLEDIIARLSGKVVGLHQQNTKITQLEKELHEARITGENLKKAMAETELHAKQAQIMVEAERQQFSATAMLLESALDRATEEKTALMKEISLLRSKTGAV